MKSYPSLPWIAPFAVFMALLAMLPLFDISYGLDAFLRVVIPTIVLFTVSRNIVFNLRLKRPFASIVLGLVVFVIWVMPDTLFPGWREHWLFQNSLTGSVDMTERPEELSGLWLVAIRVMRAALLVPIIEEIFWRGWLPRWLSHRNWERIKPGTYTLFTFIATSVLFAVEHGPFWEVGLACGLVYNYWMWRTTSLGDLVLAHAVTNICLAAWVLFTSSYGFWG